MQPPFGAIFDWDGVIIDSGALHAQSWRRLATELGRPIAADSFIRGFGMKSARIIEEIHGWAKEPAEVTRLANRKETFYREIVAQSEIAPLPGVVEWLHRLHEAGVPCAVASSTQRLNIDAVLDRIELRQAFREIVSAEDVVQYLLAGASLVQIGTAALTDPRRPERIVRDLARWCEHHGVASVRELTGALQWPA